jgi:hypothetical protein
LQTATCFDPTALDGAPISKSAYSAQSHDRADLEIGAPGSFEKHKRLIFTARAECATLATV